VLPDIKEHRPETEAASICISGPSGSKLFTSGGALQALDHCGAATLKTCMIGAFVQHPVISAKFCRR